MQQAGYRFLRRLRAAWPETVGPEGSANPVGARWLRWTRRTLVPKSKVWVRVEQGWLKGLWMRLNLPEDTFLWRGDHEGDVQALLAKFLQPGYVAYDIGSYLGFFALGMARAVGAAGEVVAFEPDPENAARIAENVARNGMHSRIKIVESAVWRGVNQGGIVYRRGRRIRSQGGVEADGMRPVLATGEQILVACTSLDEFIARGNRAPQLLKIDVEGGEAEVLAGADRLLTRHRPLIICEVHHVQAARWLEERLPERGYQMQWLIPAESFPRRLVAQPN